MCSSVSTGSGTSVSSRNLAESWVDAGHRRRIARALYRGGIYQKEIADLLGVSQAQISRDVREQSPPLAAPGDGDGLGSYDTDELDALTAASRRG